MLYKKYKTIFFDWDGTAVVTRTAPADQVIPLMTSLLEKDIQLLIISGTTYENIVGGKLHEIIRKDLLKNLYLGLGRGAYNYGFDNDGKVKLLKRVIPDRNSKIKIHEICYDIHRYLLENYNYDTDIIFSRPNYCKIDLLVDLDRREKLFLQPGEIDLVSQRLKKQGYDKDIKGLMDYAAELGKKAGIRITATTDAKYLEVGISTKSDNVDYLLNGAVLNKGIKLEECCFWGDEFTLLGYGMRGSDSYMITELSQPGDFFDVSEAQNLPCGVNHVGGGVKSFLEFLKIQANY